MSTKISVITAILLTTISANVLAQGNTTIQSFDKSKKLLMTKVYNSDSVRKTVYCDAQFNSRKKVILPKGYENSVYKKRAKRIEFEHIIPAENFGRTFKEWREGSPMCVKANGNKYKGRRCATKASSQFRYMQADLYNLWAAQGSVNAAHSNFRWSALPHLQTRFGSCNFKYDTKNRLAEPTNKAKGIVARTAMYMTAEYPQHYKLSKQQQRLFSSWDKQYPVTKFECQRAKIIAQIQGNINPILAKHCK